MVTGHGGSQKVASSEAVVARIANQDRCSLLQKKQLTYLTEYRKVPTTVAAAVIMPLYRPVRRVTQRGVRLLLIIGVQCVLKNFRS